MRAKRKGDNFERQVADSRRSGEQGQGLPVDKGYLSTHKPTHNRPLVAVLLWEREPEESGGRVSTFPANPTPPQGQPLTQGAGTPSDVLSLFQW